MSGMKRKTDTHRTVEIVLQNIIGEVPSGASERYVEQLSSRCEEFVFAQVAVGGAGGGGSVVGIAPPDLFFFFFFLLLLHCRRRLLY